MPLRTDKIVKIWFSSPGTPPLGHPVNKARLRQHRASFPNDQIFLISNYEGFEDDKKRELEEFCSATKITLISLDNIEDQLNASDIPDKKLQLSLLKIAREEIRSEHGCLAAASDIIRVLSPVVSLGGYMDVDDVKLSAMGQHITSKLGLVLDVTFDKQPRVTHAGNTPIFCDESKNNFLQYYRRRILESYTRGPLVELNDHFRALFIPRIRDHLAALMLKQIIIECAKGSKELQNRLINEVDLAFMKDLEASDFIQLRHKIVNDLPSPSNALKLCVLAASGPNCLQFSLDKWLQEELEKHLKKLGYNVRKDQSTCWQILNQIDLETAEISGEFKNRHENDTVWLSAEDDSDKNYQKYYAQNQSSPAGAALVFSDALARKTSGHSETVSSAPTKAKQLR